MKASMTRTARIGILRCKGEDKAAPSQEPVDKGGCTLAGPGRGDCEHFVGLPGVPIPGQHDGDDDTVDAYGKPNGWCWSCWKSKQLNDAAAQIAHQKRMKEICEQDNERLTAVVRGYEKQITKLQAENAELRQALVHYDFCTDVPQQAVAAIDAALKEGK